MSLESASPTTSHSSGKVLRFVAYSDYLCPWCWVASRRLERLIEEYEGRIEVLWRSYLLRPVAKMNRDEEKFKRYTESWARPGAELDAPEFRVWHSVEKPPTHSIPAHLAAKAAARVSGKAFSRLHDRLMVAYFTESRDISSMDVLRQLWDELGLPPEAFFAVDLEEIHAEVLEQHEEARQWGANGVPAIRRIDNDAVIVGAHPEALYRRWIDRSLERGEGLVDRASVSA